MRRLTLFALIFAASHLWGAAPVTITIGTGGQTDTYAHARATSTATPQMVYSQVSNLTDTITVFDNNVVLYNGNGYTLTNNGVNITVGSSLSGPTTIINYVLSDTLNDTTSQNIAWAITTAGSSVSIGNCSMTNTLGHNVRIGQTMTTSNQLIFDNCKFFKTGAGFDNLAFINQTGTGTIAVKNCLLSGFTNTNAIQSTGTSGSPLVVTNCTIKGHSVGVLTANASTYKNCLFVGNTTDVSLTAPASNSDFTYCAFGQLGSGPANSLFGINAALEFNNSNPLSLYDFRLGPGSRCMFAGTPVAGVTADILGNLYDTAAPSIGCFQYTGWGFDEAESGPVGE